MLEYEIVHGTRACLETPHSCLADERDLHARLEVQQKVVHIPMAKYGGAVH